MATETQIQKHITDTLHAHGLDLEKRIRREARRLDVEDTKDLINSVKSRLSGNKALQIIFNEYGRFVDMGAGGPAKGVVTLRDRRGKMVRPRAPRQFYTPIAFGTIGRLINRLQNGLINEAIRSAKKIKQ